MDKYILIARRLQDYLKKASLPYILLFALFAIFLVSGIYGSIFIETAIAFHLDPGYSFEQFLGWNPNEHFGAFFGTSIFLVTAIPLFQLFNWLGIPMGAYSALWLWLIFFLSLYLAFRLVKKISPNADFLMLIALPLLYTCSPFFIAMLGTNLTLWLFIHALAPGFLLYSIEFFESGRPKHLFYCALIAFFVFGGNPIFSIIYGLLAVFAMLATGPKLQRVAIFAAVLFFVTLSWNLTIIYQLLFKPGSIDAALSAEGYKMYGYGSTTLESVLGFGFWALYGTYNGEELIYLSSNYSKGTMPYLALIFITLLAIYSCLVKRSRLVLLALLVYIVSVFLIIGGNSNSPTSEIYITMYDSIPFFSIFRNGFKFAIMTDIVILLCLSALAKAKFPLKSALLLALVVMFLYPLLTNPVVHEKTFIKVPSYWPEAAAWINSNTDYNFILHHPAPYFPKYYWGLLASDISNALVKRPNIYTVGPPRKIGTNYTLYSGMNRSNWTDFLGFYGIGYVLQKNDINFSFYEGTPSPAASEALFGSTEGLALIKRFDKLVLYQIDREKVRPHIYASLSCVKYSPKDYSSLLGFISSASREKAIFSESGSDCSGFSGTADVVASKSGSSIYYLRTNGTAADYYIVFTENYDSGWVVIDASSPASLRYAPSLQVNGFENGFHISGMSNSLVMVYVPTFVLSFALGIQLLVLLLLFLAFANDCIGRPGNRQENKAAAI